LEQITRTLGTEELYAYVEKYNMDMDMAYEDVLGKNKRKPWKSYITPENKHLAVPEALDILERMLVYDHDKRPTAKECM
jgi:casein kinase II subunit alpha